MSEVNRNQCCEQFSAAGKPVWQSSAFVSPTVTLKTDSAPIGDDIEPIEVPPEDVEMENDEEEPMEAGCLQKLVCCMCRRSLVDNIEMNCWLKKERKDDSHCCLRFTVS